MSPFSRIIPQALCCFYIPQSQHQDDDQQAPSLQPIPQTVPRKPAPYAMINVPHGPEMADVHQFRRMFTASPACPHENTPIRINAEHLNPRGSLDLDYAFNSGSPAPVPKKSTSIQKISQHIKEKVSSSRLSKHSSRAESRDDMAKKTNKKSLDPIADGEAIMLGVSVQSTGLSDLLRSRNGSDDLYDSDAQSIATPQLRSAAGTIELSPQFVRKVVAEVEIQPEDSVSNHLPSPSSAENLARTPPALNANPRFSAVPCTPEKTLFSEALQVQAGESPSDALKHVVAGIADKTIHPQADNELRPVSTPTSQTTDKTFKIPLKPGLPSSSNAKEPDTPQTVVECLSKRVQHEKRASKQSTNSGQKSTPLLDQLDPAMFEYLSSQSSSSLPGDAGNKPISPQTADKNEDNSAVPEQPERCSHSHTTSQTDVVSMISNVPSDEQTSVHLFNMHISRQLASKSTANMLSPLVSGNNSRKSLDMSQSARAVPSTTSVAVVRNPVRLRAEHNRRPSDPCTKQLFEAPGQASRLQRVQRSTSIDRSKVGTKEKDDASSFYTHDGGPPSSAGSLPAFDGTTALKRNPNSVAIGGRAASLELPMGQPGRTFGNLKPSSVPQRSLSTSGADRTDALETASTVINSYLDGSFDSAPPAIQLNEAKYPAEPHRSSKEVHIDSKSSADTDAPALRANAERRASAGWLTDGQRLGWNFNFVNAATPTQRKYSAVSTVAPNDDPTPLKETATDMWNRAYRDARKENGDLLTTPTIEMDSLQRRSSSLSTTRPRHKSSALLQTPQSALRRSQSVGPHARKVLGELPTSSTNGLSKTFKKLSLRRLRPTRSQASTGFGPKKLQKKSSPELMKKTSFSTSKDSASKNFGVGNTPPLKEILGIWATFPSHDREQRAGAAGELDNVRTRDFGAHASENEVQADLETPLERRSSTGALSAIHSTLRMLSIRSKGLNRTKTRSMSFPTGSPHRVQKSSKALFLKRWRRLYRSQSSEWQGYVGARGHRSSTYAGQAVEYPELETLPGEGLFAWNRRSASKTYDGVFANEEELPRANNGETDGFFAKTGPSTTKDKENIRWRARSDSSLCEPVVLPRKRDSSPVRNFSLSEKSISKTTNTTIAYQPRNIMSRGSHSPTPASRPSAVSRASRDLHMRGGFGEN